MEKISLERFSRVFHRAEDKKVGFSATPHDGIKKAIQIADYRCQLNGGEGVLRELTDLIFEKKFLKNKLY